MAGTMMRDRVEATLAEVGDRFPLHADPDTGRWHTTARGSWAGGCWAGLLWLLGRPEAPLWTARLDCWADADTVLQALIFWYGRGDTERTAKSLAAMAIDGIVPWGTAFGEHEGLRADGAAGVVPVLASAGYPELARSHVDAHLAIDESWPRGRAWLLLAAADAVHWLGDDYRAHADARAAAWCDPGDTAADAIAAVALLKLGHDATPLLDRLAGHVADGRLLGGTYEELRNHELVWGTFFYALALAIAAEEVSPHAY
ncbi:hypothetical protein ACIA8G_11330 [Lentzea sp. NPDC051213]|uniref:hypothetical protein n=1 Tax=Lentzea sp. NPDC051213 TaxID=3364126 RepID=UPI003790D366